MPGPTSSTHSWHFTNFFSSITLQPRISWRANDLGPDTNAAITAYAECEERHRGDREIQVILISSDSIETIEQTMVTIAAPWTHLSSSRRLRLSLQLTDDLL